MELFQYYAPTRVVFGRGAEEQTGELVRACGGRKALLHYGGGSVARSGLLERVKASLDRAGVAYAELGGVVPNPRLSLVNRGIELVRREGVDFILAVGGGSVIDSGKAIGYGVANGGDVWDFYCGRRKATACLPVGVVLTLAATGSEMSNSSVITNEDGWLKRGYTNDLSRPVFAALNPELTMTLPAYQTACGCADILMHTLERYLNGCQTNLQLTDALAEGLMRTVIRNAKVLKETPQDYPARAEIMWAGSLSHNGLTGFCTDNGDWMTHKLEHELSGMFDVAHGAGLTAVWGSWARYVSARRPERFARLGVNVLGVEPGAGDGETAQRTILIMEGFFRDIGMPTSLRELGVDPTPAQLEEMADKCALAVGGTGGSVQRLSRDDMLAIYRLAMA